MATARTSPLPWSDVAVLHHATKLISSGLTLFQPVGLDQDVVAEHADLVAAFDAVFGRIFGIDLGEGVGPAILQIGLADLIEARLPDLVDAAGGDPEFALLTDRA